jgi:hypothetical protein
MLIVEEQGTDKVELIKKAIDGKYILAFWYKGVGFRDPNEKGYVKQGWRYVKPVALGKSPKTDKLMMRAEQYMGTSNTNKEAWKTFLVDEMSNVSVWNGKDSAYQTFDKPGLSDYNPSGDEKFKGKVGIVPNADFSKPVGQNMGQQNNKPEEKPEEELELEPELETEPIKESSGFLKWVLTL